MNYSIKLGGWKFAKATTGVTVAASISLWLAAQLAAAGFPVPEDALTVTLTALLSGAQRFVFNWLKVNNVLEV